LQKNPGACASAKNRDRSCLIFEAKLTAAKEKPMTAKLTADTLVKDVLDRHPEAVKAFIDLGLMCVGCPVAGFHTLTDVAREHRRDLAGLLRELNRGIQDAARVLATAGAIDRRDSETTGCKPNG
jgi:hybrid cluster-associated redox disulfide protein